MNEEGLHPLAYRYSHDADAYDFARPSFPRQLGALIEPLTDRDVLEVGAGTGKFTRNLVEQGGRVTAVEPINEMRNVLERKLPTVIVLAGSAEALPVDDMSADVYVAVEAFHWFNPERAWSEIRRVLRPGGLLLIAWLRRDVGYAWQAPVYQALQRVTNPDTSRFEFSVGWKSGWADDFTPQVEHRIEYEVDYTIKKLQAMFATYSYVIDLDSARRAALFEEIGDIVRQHESRAIFPMKLALEAWTCERLR